MKNNLILIITAFFFISCSNEKTSKIEYKKNIDFGSVNIGDTVIKTFSLKNVSTNQLKISQIKTSCGCTLAILKDSLIDENKSAEISVEFIANKDKKGKIKNSIVVEANTDPVFTVLYLTGIVK
jgi:PBP1b-binding outer membrane lipoprotein LpoB